MRRQGACGKKHTLGRLYTCRGFQVTITKLNHGNQKRSPAIGTARWKPRSWPVKRSHSQGQSAAGPSRCRTTIANATSPVSAGAAGSCLDDKTGHAAAFSVRARLQTSRLQVAAAVILRFPGPSIPAVIMVCQPALGGTVTRMQPWVAWRMS